MFVLYANKTQLTIHQKEPLTSGSVNVYQVRFEFSPDWDGLEKTAIFQAGCVEKAISLTGGACTIPAEVLGEAGYFLMAGVCGKLGENTVLTTIWSTLGLIQEGAVSDNPTPPPEDWQEALEGKGDNLAYTDNGELGLYSGDKLLSSVPIEGGGGSVTPNIQATAETLPAGSEATVTRTGSNANPVFNFGIPEGDPGNPGTPGAPGAKGDPGKDATINGKNAVTLAAGQNVTVTTGDDGTVTISAAGGGGEVYSTEETVIGTWIDGKPLYRKVYVTNAPNVINSEVPVIQGLNPNFNFVKIYGTAYDSAINNSYYPMPMQYSSEFFISAFIRSNNLYVMISSIGYKNIPCWFVLEYTKTTDQATLETESTNEEEA